MLLLLLLIVNLFLDIFVWYSVFSYLFYMYSYLSNIHARSRRSRIHLIVLVTAEETTVTGVVQFRQGRTQETNHNHDEGRTVLGVARRGEAQRQ